MVISWFQPVVVITVFSYSAPPLKLTLCYPKPAQARASISQCGYNTAMEIVQAQAPALVVPFADGGEDEQFKRARRLEALSAMRVLEQKQLTPKRMAEEMRKLLE